MRTPTTYFTLSFTTERAPEGHPKPQLPEALASIAEAIAYVAGLGLPFAWFDVTQWEAWTLDEEEDECLASCSLDEAAEGGYTTLDH